MNKEDIIRKVANKYGEKEWTLITIESNECWACGDITKTTNHHAVPQYMKPKQNVIIPVCEKCHAEINKRDFRGMMGWMYKLSKQTSQIAGNIKDFMRREK